MEHNSDNFEEFYKTNYSMLRNTARNIVSDSDASHDIVQEVFIRIWNMRDSLGHILNQKAYLKRAVVNASIAYLEANKKHRTVEYMDYDSGDKTDSSFLARELEYKIQQAFEKLPPKCKAVFTLSRYEGMKNKEIAALLDLSLKTVENQMGIALKKMRDDLAPYINKEYLSLIATASMSYLIFSALT